MNKFTLLNADYYLAKRIIDLLIIVLFTPIILPLIPIVCMAIIVSSKGRPIFKQQRIGYKGKPFMMFKFRTMQDGAENGLASLSESIEDFPKLFKLRNDPRTTKLGRFLRRYSIDEIPQLLNVLRGEMSLVGPRPPIPSEVASYNSREKQRLLVLPGMTGLWQITGRSELSFDEMIELDLRYIKNCSLYLDIYILIRTIPTVVKARGAY